MPLYKNILVAIDLTEESRQVLEKAFRQSPDASISVIHVSQPLTQLYGGEIGVNLSSLQNEMQIQAEKLLAKKLDAFDIPKDQQHLLLGKPSTEIRRVAGELKVDLIVIGNHSRHGFGLLLGSTANGVLHDAKCDVLVVRVTTDS